MNKGISLCVLLLILGLVWLGCGSDNTVSSNIDYYAEEPFSFNVDVQDQSRFRLEGITGTVELTGRSDVTAITISGERRVESSSKEDAEARLEDLAVEVHDLTTEVLVKTIQPEDTGGANYIVDYVISLPRDLEVKVSNLVGTVEVDSVDNKVTVNSVGGDIDLDETNGGVLTVLITGNIFCKATLPPDGVIDLSTVTGNIVLHIPEETSAQLSANVSTGTMHMSGLTLQNQNVTNTSVSGTLGEGNGTITVRAVTGNVTISGYSD